MSHDDTALADRLVAETEAALRDAADMRQQIARDRATARTLREYLLARATPDPTGAAVPAAEAVSPACLRDARAYARRCCAEHGVTGDRQDALELAVSELVGNAVRHGRPPVAYDITVDGDDLLLNVADADPTPPTGDRGCCEPDAESGRGLFLVAELSRGWGWEPTMTGKRIWARI